jgi:predicted AAA+ superfamily ATPase
MVDIMKTSNRKGKATTKEDLETVMCKNAMPKLIKAIKETGLTVIGSKSCGKSNAVKCLLKELSKDSTVIAIDFATNYAFELGRDFKVKFLNENYLIKKPKIDLTQNLIIDISQTSKNIASQIITEIN